MVRLSRTVRFCVNETAPASDADPAPEARSVRSAPCGDAPAASNGFGGVPAMRGLGRFYELHAAVAGSPDPATGYLLNIKAIDRAVRAHALPLIESACRDRPWTDPASLLPSLFGATRDALAGEAQATLEHLRWSLTPTYSVAISRDAMSTDRDRPHAVTLRQRFDFAAAHRLHTPTLSDEENRAAFGKCNNPAGHGHNYVFEPAVAVHLRPGAGEPAFTLAELERLADDVLLERFDHTHLNVDTDEFSSENGGLNPSVEHIARVFFDLLAPAVARASAGDAELTAMTVWETDRTCATYSP